MNIAGFPDKVVKALEWPFDFSIHDIPIDQIWFSVRPKASLTAIVSEGGGGIYASVDDTGEIVFVNSEGAGSIVASSLESLLLTLVCHPYWRDLLKFSGRGSLQELRRTLPFAERDYYEHQPGAITLASMVRSELRLPETKDMVNELHRSVASPEQKIQIYAPDGSKFTNLFNRFTVMDNPAWRRRAEQADGPDEDSAGAPSS